MELFTFRFPALVRVGRQVRRNGHSTALERSLQQMPGVFDFGIVVVALNRAVHFGAHSLVHLGSEDVGQNDRGDDQAEDDEDDGEVDD